LITFDANRLMFREVKAYLDSRKLRVGGWNPSSTKEVSL
jgi:hypothetical protein